MQIISLKIVGLYGYIDKSIDFNKDLTLLVGINGSGKTSILNIINWIVKPSIANLCITEFVSIELLFYFNDKIYIVTCKHYKRNFKYFIKVGKEKFNSLNVRLNTPPSEIKNDEVLKSNLLQYYSGLTPDQKEKKTWDLISTFPNPTIIGLDRNLYTEESDRIFIEESIRGKNFKRQSLPSVSPLDRVKEIVNREYRKKKNDILKLTDSLKNQLMLSTFDGSITVESFTAGIRHKLDNEQIVNVENRVGEYFNKFEKKVLTEDEQNTIRKYFSSLRDITIKYQSDPDNETTKLLYGLNANQFVKVNKLLREFEKFETKSNEAIEQITNYINTLNYFLKDSAKRLLFREDTSEIVFNSLDKEGKAVTELKDVKFLSSGEQQILILFSYIAFNSGDGRIFIIDEPELSLHVKWQEDFLDYLEKITPQGTQLILATHSPILASKKRNKARVLLPYNT